MKKNIILYYLTFLVCNCVLGNNIPNDTVLNTKNCKNIILPDDKSAAIFDFSNNFEYEKVLNLYKEKISVLKEEVTNAFDSTYTDTLITLKLNNNNFVYYNRAQDNQKILIQVEIFDLNYPYLPYLKIGDDYNIFWKNVISKFIKNQKWFISECVSISDLSDYNELYYFFKNKKLKTFIYYMNIDSF
jgi:hypothetical protein